MSARVTVPDAGSGLKAGLEGNTIIAVQIYGMLKPLQQWQRRAAVTKVAALFKADNEGLIVPEWSQNQ